MKTDISSYLEKKFKKNNLIINSKNLDELFNKFELIYSNLTTEFIKNYKREDILYNDYHNFKKDINPINEENKDVTSNQISNMSNIHQSLLLAKESDDLIYFVEDDYIHSIQSIKELVLTYEKLSSLFNNELILCPADYPYLYWDSLTSMCKLEHYPFEKPLHKIYEKEHCLSPIPSLAMHCTNINSLLGIPPNYDWKQIWDENEDP